MQNKTKSKISSIVLIVGCLFIFLDLGFSFKEFHGHALYGDVIPLILPDDTNAPVLSDPFGFKALSTKVYHPNINRYFCVASLQIYMKQMPLFLQYFTNPVESLYLSSSFFRAGIYLSFIFFMFRVIRLNQRDSKTKWIALISLLPFLQNSGVNICFDFIGESIVYAFFYGFPVAMLCFFIFPFLKAYIKEEIALKDKLIRYVIHFALGFCLLFSSALIPPILLIIIALYGLIRFWNSYKIKRIIWTKKDSLFAALFCVGIYSLILGGYNSESVDTVSVLERYSRLMTGFYEYFFKKPALLVSWLSSLILYKILGKKVLEIWNGKFKVVVFLGIIFCLIYVFSLPLGGFREYRPHILRGDTLLPVGVFSWGLVSMLFYYTMAYAKNNIKKASIILFILVSIYFSITEFNTSNPSRTCERNILYKLAECPEGQDIIYIKKDGCPVIDWVIAKEPSYYENHSKLWQHWNITNRKILLSFEEAPW